MPSKPDKDDKDKEVAEVNAELAVSHAEEAKDAVARAERELAEASKERVNSRLCPNCNGELVKHGDANPHKAGASHCDNCGACWAPGLKEMREGHAAPEKWTTVTGRVETAD